MTASENELARGYEDSVWLVFQTERNVDETSWNLGTFTDYEDLETQEAVGLEMARVLKRFSIPARVERHEFRRVEINGPRQDQE